MSRAIFTGLCSDVTLACHTTDHLNVHTIVYDPFQRSFLYYYTNKALISSIAVPPSHYAMSYYMLNAQLFLQPQPHIEHIQSRLQKLFLRLQRLPHSIHKGVTGCHSNRGVKARTSQRTQIPITMTRI
jgi:hypothetical protein